MQLLRKSTQGRFFAFSFFVLVLFSFIKLYADTASDLQASIVSINKQLDAINKEIVEYNKKISQTQGESKTLKSALARLEIERGELLKRIGFTNLQIEKTNKKISLTEENILFTTKSIDVQQGAIREILRASEQEKDRPPLFLSLLNTGNTLSSIFDTIAKNANARDAMTLHVRGLRDSKNALENTKVIYEESHKELQDLQGTLLGQKSIVESNSKDKANLLYLTKNKESEFQKLLTDRKNKKTSLEQEMQDFEAKLKVVIDLNKLPKYGSGSLAWPLKNIKITQYFGNTPFASANPQLYVAGSHNGIDLGASVGTPVYSSQSGIVLGTGNTDEACVGVSYGKWILIKHENGLTTLYGHLSKINVVEGQRVTAGEKVALSGKSGYVTGPHLHFTVYASDAVKILGPTEYISKTCRTYMVFPVSPRGGYLNPLSYL